MSADDKFGHDVGCGEKGSWMTRLCVSDYGAEVYPCRFTGKPVHSDNCRIVGPMIPQASGVRYVASLDSKAEEKASRRDFDENEANCNTCRHLQRVPSRKGVSGLLYGKCLSTPHDSHPYGMENGIMSFAPDDWMGMPCWEPRGN